MKKLLSLLLSVCCVLSFANFSVYATATEPYVVDVVEYDIVTDIEGLIALYEAQNPAGSPRTRSSETEEEMVVTQKVSDTVYSDGSVISEYATSRAKPGYHDYYAEAEGVLYNIQYLITIYYTLTATPQYHHLYRVNRVTLTTISPEPGDVIGARVYCNYLPYNPWDDYGYECEAYFQGVGNDRREHFTLAVNSPFYTYSSADSYATKNGIHAAVDITTQDGTFENIYFELLNDPEIYPPIDYSFNPGMLKEP